MLRNEIIFLQSQRDKWAMRANFAKETYHSFKKESERQVTCRKIEESSCNLAILRHYLLSSSFFLQLLALKNEKELISKAEEQARNKVHSLSEKLQNSQVLIVTNFSCSSYLCIFSYLCNFVYRW